MAKKRPKKNTAAIVNRKILSLTGPKKARVDIHLSSLSIGATQKAVLKKLLKTGDFASLTDAERNKIKDIKFKIPRVPGDPQALIVRFDWKWVRIDEPKRGTTDPGPFAIRKR